LWDRHAGQQTNGEWFPITLKLWENAWVEFMPFLAFDPEIRSVIYTTNAIELLNARSGGQ
jgi:putative transposase